MSTTTQAPIEVATDDALEWLRARARADFASLGKPRPASAQGPEVQWRLVSKALRESLEQAGNARLLKSALTDTGEGLREMRRLPETSENGHPRKRILAAADSFLEAVGFEFDADLLRAYFSAGQELITLYPSRIGCAEVRAPMGSRRAIPRAHDGAGIVCREWRRGRPPDSLSPQDRGSAVEGVDRGAEPDSSHTRRRSGPGLPRDGLRQPRPLPLADRRHGPSSQTGPRKR